MLNAVIIITGMGVIGIVAITLARPAVDNTAIIVILIAFLSPTILSVMALLKNEQTAITVRDLHKTVVDEVLPVINGQKNS